MEGTAFSYLPLSHPWFSMICMCDLCDLSYQALTGSLDMQMVSKRQRSESSSTLGGNAVATNMYMPPLHMRMSSRMVDHKMPLKLLLFLKLHRRLCTSLLR